jgi:hypothetical protein
MNETQGPNIDRFYETKGTSIDRSPAKRYFKGAGIWPWLLIIIGVPLISVAIGIVMIIVGIIWIVAVRLSAAAYERQVDEIIAAEQEYLLQRGTKKLSLVEEQTQLIEPIKTVGMSYQPMLVSEGKTGLFAALKKRSQGNAPILVSRIGKDDKWRFSLIQINIFIFGENQLYIYFAHVDITTGLIFHEVTHEYFYKDVCGVTYEQKLESKFNIKKKKFQNVVLEFINVYTPGCHHSAGFDTSQSGTTIVDKQFAAMRSLIRDKKEET